MKKKQEEQKGGAPEWMATYGDLVTLLMCFFVLLFAFSSIDAQKFQAVMQSFQGSAGVLESGKSLVDADLVFDAMPESDTTDSNTEAESLESVKEQIEEYLESQDLIEEIEVSLEMRGLVIRFKDNALFDSGKASLKENSKKTLMFLADILKTEEFQNRSIKVEGHTDNVPIRTSRFPSNWELSTTRASNVVKFFINDSKISPSRLGASGYSEYHPIADNRTIEGRSKNRRVDIVILRSFFPSQEPIN